MNVVDSIRATAAQDPDHPAVIDGARRVTYRELMARVDALAREARTAGLAPGQRVAFVYPDGADYIAGSLAILSLHAAVVPVSPALMAGDAARVVRDMDVHAVVAPPDAPSWPALGGGLGSVGTLDPAFAMALRPGAANPPEFAALDPAFIRFTSGTTDASKGVVLSHRTILERTDAADRGLGITPRDVVLWVLSMSFHFVVTILLFLRRGATVVLCQQPFPRALADGVRRHGGTFIYASPFHYQVLATVGGLRPADLARVRMAVSTAMKLPASVADLCARRLGIELAEAYGIIEVGLPFVQRAPRADRRGSLGAPLPDYEARIDAPDATGAGEILLRGPGMLDAYLAPWRARAQILDDGWFRTGDVGRMEEDGSLRILGRVKNVINFNGMKVFPDEVEELLRRHRGIRDCRVVGDPHPLHGQVPAAEIVVADGCDAASVAAELRDLCTRELAVYKRPHEVRPVASLPRTASGKVRRG